MDILKKGTKAKIGEAVFKGLTHYNGREIKAEGIAGVSGNTQCFNLVGKGGTGGYVWLSPGEYEIIS